MLNRLLGLSSVDTVDTVLRRNRGVGPGFDLVRVLFSLYIFYGHSLWAATFHPSVAGGTGGSFTGWTRPFHLAVVPLFFALSGFLVTGSALRLRTVSTFLAFRVLRIFPALLVELALCGFLLGPALTTLPLGEYFSSHVFFEYFGNSVGLISFQLPGLFASNPIAGIVNINLWTLPSELNCYLLTAALMATRVFYRKILFTVAFTVATAVLLYANVFLDYAIPRGPLPPVIITYYFFVGVLFYHWREQVRVNPALFIACCAVTYTLYMFDHTMIVVPIFATYCLVFTGMVAIPKLPLIRTGDYSYGIYLYGFPIIQGLLAAFPSVFVGHGTRLLACGAVCVSLFACFSWHVIEKRVLPMKRYLPASLFPVPARAVLPNTPVGRPAGAAVEASQAADAT